MNDDMFKAVLTQSVDGVLVIDADGVVRFANPAAIAMFAGKTGELVGSHLGVPAVEQPTELLIPAGRDTRFLHVEIRACEIQWEGQAASLANLRDVTGRVEAQDAIEEASTRLAEAVTAGNVGLWDWDLVTNAVHFSAELKRQIGYDEHEISDEYEEWRSRVHPDDLQATEERVRDSIDHVRPDHEVEFRFRHKNGSYRWILAHASVIADDKGVAIRMLGAHLDITERKRTEERQALFARVLTILNRANEWRDLLRDLLAEIKTHTGFDAVGIRLFSGGDCPYYVQNGFPEEFVRQENHLACLAAGTAQRDETGKPVLECTCGRVLSGRAPADNSMFTLNGSFWSNDTTRLLDLAPEQDPRHDPRNRCIHDGYKSVALIPLRAGTEIIGLLQLNDRHPDRFTLDRVRFFEEIGNSIGIAYSRVRQEEQLRKREELLNETGDMARVGGWEIDLDTDTVIWTRTTRAIHEVPDDYVPTLEQAVDFYPDARDELSEAIRRAREDGIPFDMEMPFVTATGRKLWTHALGKSEFRDSRCVRLYGTFQDITARRLAEEELNRAQENIERLARFPAENPNPVFRVARDGTVAYANEASRILLETITTEHGKLLPEWQDRIAAVLAGGRAEETETRSDTRTFIATLMPVTQHAYVNIYALDVTEKLALEAQLRQSLKLESIGTLAGGVAHDFNNLLMGIMNYVELCRDGISPDHPIREWLDEITADAQRSANLTRQLLAFARKQTIAPEVLDLNEAIGGMLKLLRRLIGEDVELNWKPGLEPWPVKIDPSQVDQILANLCVNARDAIDGVGAITIETENAKLDTDYCANHADAVPGLYVVLSVTDTGCGMDRETCERIFDPFFTTKEVGQGTGLGLATVHGIVKQNNGHINVYSEPGKGTTFRIYLPRFGGVIADATETQAAGKPLGGSETILLVEDEKSIRVTAALFLEVLGYTVLAVETPDQALRLAAEHAGRIQLLITDVVMPGMNGRDLAERLHEIYPHVKRLFMSGYTADVIARRGILDEGVNFLSKPFNRDDLAHKVREVLDA